MGWARIIGSALALSQFVAFSHYPPGVKPAGIAIGTAFAAFGWWTLRVVRRDRSADALERLMFGSFAVDVGLLIALNLLLAYETDATTRGLMLVMVLEGAMKFGRRGAWAVLGAVLLMEIGRGTLRTVVHGLNSDIAEGTFFLGLTLLVAAFAGEMAKLAERSLEDARAEAQRAEDARRDLDALHEVLLVGVDAITADSLGGMLGTAAVVVGFQSATIVQVDGDGTPYVAATSGGHHPLLQDLDPAPDSALAEALSGVLEPVRRGPTEDTPTEIAVAFATPSGARGALWFREPVRDRRVSDTSLMSLASQTGVVVQAAEAMTQQGALNDQLRSLDQLRRDFMTVASHELRTPLTAVLGFAETLVHRTGVAEEEARAIARIILRQAGRLAALVDDLNTVLELDAEKLTVSVGDTDVLSAVVPAVERVDIPVDVSGVDDAVVIADPTRLTQALSYLLLNAKEHGGGVNLAVSTRTVGDDVEIRVSDGGPGVPPAIRPRIFERFFQGIEVMHHAKGTGLGLPIARQLIRAMGGELTLDNATEVGAAFVITLRAATPALALGGVAGGEAQHAQQHEHPDRGVDD